MRLLVIGGSDAGIAALRARELDPSLEALGTATTQRPQTRPTAVPGHNHDGELA